LQVLTNVVLAVQAPVSALLSAFLTLELLVQPALKALLFASLLLIVL
jgi:hypothetical protein